MRPSFEKIFHRVYPVIVLFGLLTYGGIVTAIELSDLAPRNRLEKFGAVKAEKNTGGRGIASIPKKEATLEKQYLQRADMGQGEQASYLDHETISPDTSQRQAPWATSFSKSANAPLGVYMAGACKTSKGGIVNSHTGNQYSECLNPEEPQGNTGNQVLSTSQRQVGLGIVIGN